MLNIIIFSGLAGIVGTVLGGLIGVNLGKKTERVVSLVLSFAGGIMISIAMFDLIPEALELSNSLVVGGGIILGVLLIGVLNYVIDKKTQHSRLPVATHVHLDELYHEQDFINHKHNLKGLVKAGFIMLLAITLHNVPEGLAIGATGVVNTSLSVTLAILLAIHNIPEGMAIAVPLVAGGVKTGKTLFLIFLAGATTIIGGVLGVLLGSLSPEILSLALAFAGGAMLYVTMLEIMPQSILLEHDKLPSWFSLFGILLGFILTNLI